MTIEALSGKNFDISTPFDLSLYSGMDETDINNDAFDIDKLTSDTEKEALDLVKDKLGFTDAQLETYDMDTVAGLMAIARAMKAVETGTASEGTELGTQRDLLMHADNFLGKLYTVDKSVIERITDYGKWLRDNNDKFSSLIDDFEGVFKIDSNGDFQENIKNTGEKFDVKDVLGMLSVTTKTDLSRYSGMDEDDMSTADFDINKLKSKTETEALTLVTEKLGITNDQLETYNMDTVAGLMAIARAMEAVETDTASEGTNLAGQRDLLTHADKFLGKLHAADNKIMPAIEKYYTWLEGNPKAEDGTDAKEGFKSKFSAGSDGFDSIFSQNTTTAPVSSQFSGALADVNNMIGMQASVAPVQQPAQAPVQQPAQVPVPPPAQVPVPPPALQSSGVSESYRQMLGQFGMTAIAPPV